MYVCTPSYIIDHVPSVHTQTCAAQHTVVTYYCPYISYSMHMHTCHMYVCTDASYM